MRIFAFYLPQFHEVPENDKWWGTGFTEWTKVRLAKPLYKGHRQPKIPENGVYYNLLDKNTVIDQTNLMKQYGIDGFIYYHYYFNGKLILEKPASNLLNWKEIPQTFFFCWANHSWIKSTKGHQEVLIEQTYGDCEDWEHHFLYLLDFFKDERYEKIGNKPLFMLYNSDFESKNDMMIYFDKRCKESGFNGLYVIETYKAVNWPADLVTFENNCSEVTERVFLREPTVSLYLYRKIIKYSPKWFLYKMNEYLARQGFDVFVRKFDGNKLYKIMTEIEPRGIRYIHGTFFEWDNTPRHGCRGYVILPPCKSRYRLFIESVKNEDYLFFNAWNEWAEGMMLEPTADIGKRYLEWIGEIKSV